MLISAYSRRYELIDAFENITVRDLNLLGLTEVPMISEFKDDASDNINHYAIIDNSSKLVGYVVHDAYKDWGIVSFDRGNPTVVGDIYIYKLVKDMLYLYEHFYCFTEPKNPANKAYSSFVNRFDGVISKPSNMTGGYFKCTIKSKRLNAVENFINDIIKPMEFKISEDSTYKNFHNIHLKIKDDDEHENYKSFERFSKLIHKLEDSNDYISNVYFPRATYGNIKLNIKLTDEFYKSDYYLNARGPVLNEPI